MDLKKIHRPTDGTKWWNNAEPIGTRDWCIRVATEKGHQLSGNETMKEIRRLANSDAPINSCQEGT